MGKKDGKSLVSMEGKGFKDKVKPKAPDALALFACPGCGGVHFRHAGYIELMLPFISSEGEKVSIDEQRVMICVNCKLSHVWVGGQAYDVSAKIDLGAWELTEREAQRATGPGGQC